MNSPPDKRHLPLLGCNACILANPLSRQPGSAKFKIPQVEARFTALSTERLEVKVGDELNVGESAQCGSRVVAVVGLIRKGPPHSSQDGHSPLFHSIVLALNRASLRVGAEKS